MNERISKMVFVAAACALFPSAGCSKKKSVDFSGKALTETNLVIDKIPVVVGLPDGMKESALSTPDGMKNWEPVAGSFEGPEISLSTSFTGPKSLDEAVAAAKAEGSEVRRKEAIGDGYLVSTQSATKGSFAVHAWVPGDTDRAIECEVSWISPSGEIDKIDAQRTWAENLCAKVRPKNPPAKVEVIPEMTAFLGQFGKSATIAKALKSYASPGLDSHDMEIYDMKNPKIVRAVKRDEQPCYTVAAEAGMTTRTYEICWSGTKIARIGDLGMR